MRHRSTSGFSLVELAVTIMILGVVFAFSVPAFNSFSASYALVGASEGITGQLRLAREKAIATGTTQTVRFIAGFQDSDYHIWDGAVADPKWKLPHRISYFWGAGTNPEYRMTREGRCLDSGMIILQDARGSRDTISVQRSGLIVYK